MRRLIPSALVAGALFAVAVSPASAVSTRGEYAIEVNVICQEAEEDYGEAFDGLFKGKGGPGSFVTVSDAIDDVYDEMVRKIAAVPPAPGDEALVGSWIGVMQRIGVLNDRSTALLKKVYRKFKPLFSRLDQEDAVEIKPESARGRKQLRRMGIRFKRLARRAGRASRIGESLAKQLGADGCVAAGGDAPFRLFS